MWLLLKKGGNVMRPLPDIWYPQTSDKAESANYVCMQCNENGHETPDCVVASKDSKLPECKNCGATYWMKI